MEGGRGLFNDDISCLDYTVSVADEQNRTVKYGWNDKERGKLKHLKKKTSASTNLSTQTPHEQAQD